MAKSTGTDNRDALAMLSELTRSQALQVLHSLAKRDPAVAGKIVRAARDVLKRTDPGELAERLYAGFTAITNEWFYAEYHSRTFRHYEHEVDVAYDIIREEFETYLQEVEKFRRLGYADEELTALKGIILGLYRYEMDPQTDFYSYVEDSIRDFAEESIEMWKEHHPDDTERAAELNRFLKEQCQKWDLTL